MLEVLIIIAFNLFLYSRTLTFGLVMDDQQWYEYIAKHGFRKDGNILQRWAHRWYSGGTFGFNPTIDHLTTTLMWTLFSVLFYFAFGGTQVAFCAALLISCHPLMNQLSMWINGRRFLVCAILLMAIMILWNTKFWPLGFVLYLMSGLFQLSIFFAPVLFILKMKYAFVFVGFIGISLLSMKKWIKSKIDDRLKLIPCEDLRQWKSRRPVVIVKLFGFYFWKMIFPGRMQMVYPFIQMFGRTAEGNNDAYSINFDFIRGVGALCIWAGMLYYLPYEDAPLVGFAFLALLQWCAIVPVTQMMADRYAAIPTAFVCFFVVYLLHHFLPTPYFYAGITFFLTQYVISTWTVMKMYKDINSWYEYHTDEDPGNLAVTNLRIGIFLNERKLFQANTLIERALVLYPQDYGLNYLGYISAMIFQNFPLARGYIEKCKKAVYLGEEKSRQQEIDDAELALKAMMGDLTTLPQRYKNPIKKG